MTNADLAFRRAIDGLETGLPERPDMDRIVAGGRRLRRRRHTAAGLAAAVVVAVAASTLLTLGGSESSPAVDDPAPDPATPTSPLVPAPTVANDDFGTGMQAAVTAALPEARFTGEDLADHWRYRPSLDAYIPWPRIPSTGTRCSSGARPTRSRTCCRWRCRRSGSRARTSGPPPASRAPSWSRRTARPPRPTDARSWCTTASGSTVRSRTAGRAGSRSTRTARTPRRGSRSGPGPPRRRGPRRATSCRRPTSSPRSPWTDGCCSRARAAARADPLSRVSPPP